jgi:hypothetical protein
MADYFAPLCRCAKGGDRKKRENLGSSSGGAVGRCPGIAVRDGCGRRYHLFFAERAESGGHVVVIHDGFGFESHFKPGGAGVAAMHVGADIFCFHFARLLGLNFVYYSTYFEKYQFVLSHAFVRNELETN